MKLQKLTFFIISLICISNLFSMERPENPFQQCSQHPIEDLDLTDSFRSQFEPYMNCLRAIQSKKPTLAQQQEYARQQVIAGNYKTLLFFLLFFPECLNQELVELSAQIVEENENQFKKHHEQFVHAHEFNVAVGFSSIKTEEIDRRKKIVALLQKHIDYLQRNKQEILQYIYQQKSNYISAMPTDLKNELAKTMYQQWFYENFYKKTIKELFAIAQQHYQVINRKNILLENCTIS